MPASFGGDDVDEITIDGEPVTEVTMDGDVVWSSTPPEPEPDPELSGSSTFQVYPTSSAIHFETAFGTPSYETQGVCYSPDEDVWLLGEVTDTSTPSTIHEYSTAGSPTGKTFQFASATPNPNHVTAMDWVDGHLWALDYGSKAIYKIDWAPNTPLVQGSFVIGNGVVNSSPPGTMAFIPTSMGDHQLLVAMWGAPEAYFIDHDAAANDGTAAGNVLKEIQNDIDPGRIQGMHYQDGALYVTSDNTINGQGTNTNPSWFGWGSYPTIKVGFPFADNMPAGGHLLRDRYIWWYAQPNIPYNDPIQDISLNPTTGTFWTVGEGTNQIFTGAEAARSPGLPDAWNAFDYALFANPETSRSIHVDSAVATGKFNQQVFLQEQAATVETWFYDDTASTKRVYVSATSPNPEYNTTEHAIAVNTNYSTTDYVSWNATDGWHSTGVSRLSSPGWVKFRWAMDGSTTTTAVSTDDGATWSGGGTYGYGATALGMLQLQPVSGDAYVGPFSVTPQ